MSFLREITAAVVVVAIVVVVAVWPSVCFRSFVRLVFALFCGGIKVHF